MSEVVRFGGCEVDLSTGEVWRNGKRRERLQEQPLQVLAALVEEPGRLVTREALQARLWPGDLHVDFERGLNKAVQKLRAALRDSAEAPRFIETLPRKGYRFLAPVERTPGAPREPAAAAAPESARPARPWLPRLAVALTAAAGVVLLVALLAGRHSARLAAVEPGAPSVAADGTATLAILPFREIDAGGVPAHHGLGMTDTLITRLSGLSGLTVRPLGSVLVATAADGEGLDAVVAGRRLQVDHVLEGSVQRDGPRVRVSVRLLRVADGRVVWAEVMEEEGLGLFELQDAISARLTARLAPGSSPEERLRVARRLTDDEEAYRAYVRGRYFFEREDPENLRRALAEFQHAVELDPGFALAHAGITHAWAPLLTWGWMPNSEGLEPAQAAAFRALELDDGLAEAHTAVAIAHSLDWDWQAEEASYRRAIDVNPNYPTAYNWLGFLLLAGGRFEEARAVIGQAHRLDPTGLIPNILLASTLEGDEALAHLERTLELDPDFHWTLDSLGDHYRSRGDLPAAKAWFERAGSRVSAACVAVELGEPDEALDLLAELRREAATRYVSPYDTAVLHACLGEPDRAFADLERAYGERLSTLMTLAMDRRLAPVRADPRFADLVRRVGLRRETDRDAPPGS